MDIDASSKEYIDISDALGRIGGNEGLYKKLLARFTEGNYLDAISEALEKGDAEEAARAAHTLKGVSANLSLIKIQALSLELEHALKEGADHSAPLEDLKQVFNVTLDKIAEILK